MADTDIDMYETDAEELARPDGAKGKTRRSGGGIEKQASRKRKLDDRGKAAVEKALDSGKFVDEGIALEDDMDLLNDLGEDVPEVDLNNDDVLIARKMSKNRMRYYTRKEFHDKYGDTKKLRDQVLLIKGKDGIRRPLPQVYYSAEIPAGKFGREAHALRRAHFVSEMKRLDMDYIKPNFPRSLRALKPNDPQTQYDTPGGKRSRRYTYENEAVAGAQLPDVMYRRNGRLIGAYATLDGKLKGKDFKDVRKLSGFEMKSSAHSFSTPDEIDKRFGHGTAEARLDGYYGRKTRPNKSLPEVLVKVGDKYVSAELMLKHKPNSSAAKALNGSQRHLQRLKALVLNETGTSYMRPDMLKQLNPGHYRKVTDAHKLPEGFESLKRDYRLGRIMLQASAGIFRSGNDKAIEKYHGQLKQKFGDTRVFLQGDNKYGKPTGIMGMLRTYERGDKTIPREVAKDIGIEPKISTRDQRKQERQKRDDMATDSGISDMDTDMEDSASRNRRDVAAKNRSRGPEAATR